MADLLIDAVLIIGLFLFTAGLGVWLDGAPTRARRRNDNEHP